MIALASIVTSISPYVVIAIQQVAALVLMIWAAYHFAWKERR